MSKIKLQYNSGSCEIKADGVVIAGWNDDANSDYPEDLTWSRDIGSLCERIYESAERRGLEKSINELRKFSVGLPSGPMEAFIMCADHLEKNAECILNAPSVVDKKRRKPRKNK